MSKQCSEDLTNQEPIEQYSVFTRVEKWYIVALVAYAACFSTLSSFIYYPALNLLSESLSVSVDRINLTITSYMAVATIAPTLVGDTADAQGRRPVYLVLLTLYVASNVVIASTNSYQTLVGFRVVQALAISGTFSIAYGVVTDVSSPSERGSFVSVVSFAITIAPTAGPILGGALSFAAGWTWIFWFLAIAAGSCLVLMVFMLPETSRAIVGNGSIKPPRLLQLPTSHLFCHWKHQNSDFHHKLRFPNPFKSLKILIRKDNFTIITACGLLYVVYTCMNAPLSTLFVRIYGLNEWQTGLVYVPFGLGGVLSTFVSGRLLNKAYRDTRTRLGLSTNEFSGDDLDNFEVEKARLCIIWAPMAITTGTVVAFGWVLHYKQVCVPYFRILVSEFYLQTKHLAIALILQFIAGFSMQLDFSIYNTLLVDKNHHNPAAAQASSNIMRCTLAAITVAFLERAIESLGIGWTFMLMGGLCLISLCLFIIDYHKGTKWRRESLVK